MRRTNISDEEQKVLFARARQRGVPSRDDLKMMDFEPYLDLILKNVAIRRWLLPTIVIRSGSSLTFAGSGVHSLVAYRLIIEANASVVVSQVPVSIDCIHLEVQ